MPLSRRQFLIRSASLGVTALMPMPLLANDRPQLAIPPLLDVRRGKPVRLEFRPAQTQFEANKLVEVWGVNGQYLAPTVRVRSGEFVKLTYSNSLPQPLSVNIQGLQAPSAMIGSNHRSLVPNSSWSPIVSVNQPACTAWYHADTMLNSAFQLYRGVAGLWLIEDEESRKANLPNQYGVNDIPLILQDQLLNKEGVQVLNSHASQFFGSRLFVNGKASPYINVPRGWVRLRLVNASLSRVYDLRLDNAKPIYLIATGMGMLAEPLEMATVSLAPSERVELLVDLSDGESVSLINGEKRRFFYALTQLFSSDNELIDNVVLELRPEGLPFALSQSPKLSPQDLNQFILKISQERHFQLRPLDRLINQKRFDPTRIDVTAKQGSVERWYLTTNHPIGFTIQGAKWLIETRNRQKVPSQQLAWRDSVWLEPDQETTLLVKFDHTATAQLPFSFGVSDFMLRDRGAMGQLVVEAD